MVLSARFALGSVRSSLVRLGSLRVFPLLVLFCLRRFQFGILLQALSTLRFLDRFRLSLGSVLFVSVVFVLSHCGFLSLVFTWGLFLVLSPGSAVVLGGPVLPSSPAASPPFGGSTSPCFLLCLHFFLWLTFFHTEAGGECRGFPRFFFTGFAGAGFPPCSPLFFPARGKISFWCMLPCPFFGSKGVR